MGTFEVGKGVVVSKEKSEGVDDGDGFQDNSLLTFDMFWLSGGFFLTESLRANPPCGLSLYESVKKKPPTILSIFSYTLTKFKRNTNVIRRFCVVLQ